MMVGVRENDRSSEVEGPHVPEDVFGEQHFPRQMSWYAAEGRRGWIAAGGRCIRRHPWSAIATSLAWGVVIGLLARPLMKAGAGACGRGERAA